MSQLQLVQNDAARLVTDSQRCNHVTPVLCYATLAIQGVPKSDTPVNYVSITSYKLKTPEIYTV